MTRTLLLAAGIIALAVTPALAAPVYHLNLNGTDDTVSVSVNEQIKARLHMTEADRLLGFSTDIHFDNTKLSLFSIVEHPGDLNFSGDVSFEEVNNAINFFLDNFSRETPFPLTGTSESDPEQFTDSEGRHSGVVLDMNGNNSLDFEEVNTVINDFLDVFAGSSVVYWTDVVAAREAAEGKPGESVEVFDPPEASNTGGANPGVIRDITGVLLARPEKVQQGTRPGFGFTGDANLATLIFTINQGVAAGTDTTITFENSVYIDEDFQDINSDVIPITGAPATVNFVN
jgi:hypothetical protein